MTDHALTSTERAVIRRIVARHIHAALASDQALTGTTGGLTFDAIHRIKGAANAARSLQDALTSAGIDLAVELDQAAS